MTNQRKGLHSTGNNDMTLSSKSVQEKRFLFFEDLLPLLFLSGNQSINDGTSDMRGIGSGNQRMAGKE